MDSELVSVFSAGDPVTAEIVKNFLRAEGVRAFIENENQAELQGISGNEVKVLVSGDDADKARKLIHQHEPHKKKKK